MSIAASTNSAIHLLRPATAHAFATEPNGVPQSAPENVLSVFAQLLKRTSATPNATGATNPPPSVSKALREIAGDADTGNLDPTQLAQALAQWLVTWFESQQPSATPSSLDHTATTDAALFAEGKDNAAKLAAMLAIVANQAQTQDAARQRERQLLLNESDANRAASPRLRHLIAQLLSEETTLRKPLQALLSTQEAAQGWQEAATLLARAAPETQRTEALRYMPPLPEGVTKWLMSAPLDTHVALTEFPNSAETALWQRLLSEWRQGDAPGARPTRFSDLLQPAPSATALTEALAETLAPNAAVATDERNSLQALLAEKLGLDKSLARTPADGEPVSRSDSRFFDTAFPTSSAPTAPRPLLETIRTPVTQPAQWATETAERIVWHAGQAVHKIELQLNPPHLGRLEVSLQLNQDHLTAHFVAATQAARDALDQALPRLRELLQQSGIQLGQSSVSSNGANTGGSPQWENPQHAHNAWPTEATGAAVFPAERDMSAPPPMPATARGGPSAFDAWA